MERQLLWYIDIYYHIRTALNIQWYSPTFYGYWLRLNNIKMTQDLGWFMNKTPSVRGRSSYSLHITFWYYNKQEIIVRGVSWKMTQSRSGSWKNVPYSDFGGTNLAIFFLHNQLPNLINHHPHPLINKWSLKERLA